MMRLWNISFITILLSMLFVANGVIERNDFSYGRILIYHAVAMRLDMHQGTPRTILVSWAISVVLQWRFGLEHFGLPIGHFFDSSDNLVEINAKRLSAGEKSHIRPYCRQSDYSYSRIYCCNDDDYWIE